MTCGLFHVIWVLLLQIKRWFGIVTPNFLYLYSFFLFCFNLIFGTYILPIYFPLVPTPHHGTTWNTCALPTPYLFSIFISYTKFFVVTKNIQKTQTLHIYWVTHTCVLLLKLYLVYTTKMYIVTKSIILTIFRQIILFLMICSLFLF